MPPLSGTVVNVYPIMVPVPLFTILIVDVEMVALTNVNTGAAGTVNIVMIDDVPEEPAKLFPVP